MTRCALRAEQLSKAYRIRHPDAPRWREYLSSPRRAIAKPRAIQINALRDVSFEVNQGEVFGIIGRNGAGKSTLLKILSRITTPSSGSAMLRGRVASLLEVGTGFHPELTGRENVYLNGTLLGMSTREVDRVFDEVCAFAAIDAYIDTPIKRYSSGMQLRLAFAVAAHLAADTMIIDEVLAVGDAEFQEKCTGAMQNAAGRGRTTLFVSHNMAAVENLCTRVLLLEHGTVAEIGRAADVTRSYLKDAITAGEDRAYHAAPHRERRTPVWISRAAVGGTQHTPPAQGDDVVLQIDLVVQERIARLQLLIWIKTADGHPVCAVSNGDHHQEWTLDPGSYLVLVRFRAPPLLPRAYVVSVQAVTDWGADVFDDVRDAVIFSVAERDVLGTGVPILGNRGVVWTAAQFALAPTE